MRRGNWGANGENAVSTPGVGRIVAICDHASLAVRPTLRATGEDLLFREMQPQTIEELLAVFGGQVPLVHRATASASGRREVARENAQRLAERPQYFATNGPLTIPIPSSLYDEVRRMAGETPAGRERRANWTKVGALVVGVATVAGSIITWMAYAHPLSSNTAPTATPPEPDSFEFRGGDNNGGGVFLENSPIKGAVPRLRGGNGGPHGPGGPISLDNSPMTRPAPAR